MNILVDIDGTTAYNNMAVYLQLINELLHLAIADETLASIQTLEAFGELPEVQAFRARVEDWKYTHMIEMVGYDPRHLAVAKVMSGAQAGVAHLAAYGSIGYCTARSGFPWDDELHQATYQWLDAQHFAEPANVIFCESSIDKLHWIAQHLAVDPQPTLLIDDLWSALIEAFHLLEVHEQSLLKQHLILGAFRAKDQDTTDQPLRVIPLRKWDQVEAFTEHLLEVC